MIAIDEDEIDRARSNDQLTKDLRQQDMAVALVEDDVRVTLGRDFRFEPEIERVNDVAVQADAREAAASAGTDLDRGGRSERDEQALESEPIAERHQPIRVTEERFQGLSLLGHASSLGNPMRAQPTANQHWQRSLQLVDASFETANEIAATLDAVPLRECADIVDPGCIRT